MLWCTIDAGEILFQKFWRGKIRFPDRTPKDCVSFRITDLPRVNVHPSNYSIVMNQQVRLIDVADYIVAVVSQVDCTCHVDGCAQKVPIIEIWTFFFPCLGGI